MKYVAIIAAEDKEVAAVRSIMTDVSEEIIYDIKVCGYKRSRLCWLIVQNVKPISRYIR